MNQKCGCNRSCHECSNLENCGGCRRPPCEECEVNKPTVRDAWNKFMLTLAEELGLTKFLDWLVRKLNK